jgi:hypothetical protein
MYIFIGYFNDFRSSGLYIHIYDRKMRLLGVKKLHKMSTLQLQCIRMSEWKNCGENGKPLSE